MYELKYNGKLVKFANLNEFISWRKNNQGVLMTEDQDIIKLDNFLTFYQKVKKKCEQGLDKFNGELLNNENNPIIKNALEKFVFHNADGKFLRATLVALGYQTGKQDDNYLPLALAVEIFQTSILIHDDIIDKSLKRRGKDTIPVLYKKEYKVQDIDDFVDNLSDSTGIILINEGKKNFDTSEKNTIEFIQLALDYYIKTYNDIINQNLASKDKLKLLKDIGLNHFLEHGQAIDFENQRTLEITFKKWKFADMFQYFLKDRKADKKNISNINVKVSADKIMFISRLIYTVGYDGKRYNEEYDPDGNKNRKLSNLLRKYRNEDFPDFANHYYLF